MKQPLIILYLLLHANFHIFCAQNIQTILSFEEYKVQSRDIVHAVMTRNFQKVKKLLDEDVNPDTRNHYYGGYYFKNDTLLHLAVKIGAPEIITILLEKNANQSIEDTISRTPLTLCIEKSKCEECPEKKKDYKEILHLLRQKKQINPELR